MRMIHFFLMAWTFCLVGASKAESGPSIPHWITADEASDSMFVLARSVSFDENIQSATLHLAADYATAKVTFNGVSVVIVEPYCSRQSIDVTRWMKSGENRLEVAVDPVDGPTAIACEWRVQLLSGREQRFISDEQWRASISTGASLKIADLGPVRGEQWGIGRRDISLSPVENYEQWRQAASGENRAATKPKFWTVPGFEISELRTAQPDEGSWISLTFDPNGRVIISKEDRGLLRMSITQDRQQVEKVQFIDVDLKECRGLLFDGDTLYANANNSKALYRLKILEDGSAQEVKSIREFPGGVGHGRNDLAQDEQWLYLIHGDSVDLPKSNIFDLTSPARHWSGDDSQREGHLLRMHKKTNQWELLVGGLRNPYGIAVHSSGEVFTFDADNEFDMGTPWYRPTRFVALYPGGDVGYRTASNKIPPRFHDQPENLPPVLTIGRSSPTSVFFDAHLDFPKPYRDAIYLLDWTYGRIIAVHLEPQGAGWRAFPELFLQGRPLNVTDVARGPDGAMYLITGGRGTQSSLYRIAAANSYRETSATNATRDSDSALAHEIASNTFSRNQRKIRLELEAIGRQSNGQQAASIVKHLNNADPVIRHAARIALERIESSFRNPNPEHSLEPGEWLASQLAIAQAGKPIDLQRWLALEPNKLNLSQRFVWLRVCEWMMRHHPEAVQSQRSMIIARLIDAWPQSSPLMVAAEGTSDLFRHHLSRILGSLKANEAIGLIVAELLPSPVQEDRMAGLLSLKNLDTGWTPRQREMQWEAFRETERMVGGEGLPTFIKTIRNESLMTLSEGERSTLAHLIDAAPSTPTTAVSNAKRKHVRKWTVEATGALSTSGNVEGDRQRGATLFAEAQCIRCHRIGNRGTWVGPDLTFVGRRFNPKDLLDSILTPSRSVAENYRLDSIVTTEGMVYTGRLLIEGDYRSEKVRIQTDPLDFNSVKEIDKRDIDQHWQTEQSPMPDGLLDTFELDEIRDLLAYLQDPL